MLLNFHQSGVLQLPQGVDGFLPPTVEQGDYFADGIVQVNASVLVSPAVLAGQLRPAQDKGIEQFPLVGQRRECGCFKEKIRETGKADRFLRLMNINRVCHSVFCGQLEARFPGRVILYATCSVLGLAKPDKSRLFSLLTVHSRPPFLFTFCFLPPVNSGGTAGAVFCPVGFWEKGLSAYSAAFRVLIPENLRFQRPVQRQNRPAEPLAANRERNGLGAGMGVPIVKEHTVPVLAVAALPADQGVCLFPLCRCHAVKGTVRPAFQRWQVFIGVISHAFPPFFAFAVRPEKASCPIPAACSGVGTLPALRDKLSRSWLFAVLPQPGYSFSDGHSVFKVRHIDELP